MEERRYSSWMLERIDIGDTVRLRVGVSTIGRHSSSIVRITGSVYVSRHHAEIEVGENDRNVHIKDLGSINGIFVNDQHYSKQRVELKDNDLIGIGLNTNMDTVPEDVVQIPVFKLKYAPLRQIRRAIANRSAIAILSPTPPPSPVGGNSVVKSKETDKNNENNNNPNLNNEQPCCSRSIKKEEQVLNEEIFAISDDDDIDVVPKPKINSQNSLTNQKVKEIIIKEEPKNSLQNCVEQKNDLNTDTDNNDFIKPSHKYLENSLNSKNEEQKNEKLISQASKTLPNQEVIIHEPIISSVKKEIIRSMSADIQSIFGDIEDDVEIQKKIKEISPLVYNEMHASKQITSLTDKERILKNGDLVDLTSEDDYEVEELGILVPNNADNEAKEAHYADVAKSPNIFDSSLDTSKEDIKDKEVPGQQAMMEASTDNVNLDEYTKYVPNSDDEDIEDLMFSQVLFDDMKAELQDDFEDKSNLNLNLPAASADTVIIKQEPQTESFASIPEELKNSCWIISDDEDFDKELETKVNDWSNKILSQSFNQLNMSQVYDLNERDTQAATDDDDDTSMDDDDLGWLDDDFNCIAELYSNTERDTKEHKEDTFKELKEKQLNDNETEDIKLNLQNDLAISTGSEEDFQSKLICTKEKSPIKQIPENTSDLTDSPVIRLRKPSKTKPVIESSSSSEDEMSELGKQKLPDNDNETKNIKLNLQNDLAILTGSEENFQSKLICTKEKSPIKKIPESTSELTDSPVIRLRKPSKTKPVIESSSSSEDEMSELGKQKLPYIKKDQEINLIKYQIIPNNTNNLASLPVIRLQRLCEPKPVIESASSSKDEMSGPAKQKLPEITKVQELIKPAAPRLPPLIIDAPLLPKHRGKLRGVSANLPQKNFSTETSNLQKKIRSLKDKITHNQHYKDLKRKWLEKPSVTKKHDKELKKQIIQRRKDKLKELAQNKKNPCKDATKRKLSTDDHEHKTKIAKVKVTARNRGAFLADNEPTPPPPLPATHKPNQHFKIPKISKKPDEPKHSNSIDSFNTFSQQISKPDALLFKTKKCDKITPSAKISMQPTLARRHSINETIKQPTSKSPPPPTPAPINPICKEAMAARAVRTTNKITFASMEKNIIENEEIKRKLSILNSNTTTSTILTSSTDDIQVPSVLKKLPLNSCLPNNITKKTVRFNDTPVIHYIERVSGASKKVINKDLMPMTAYRDRRLLIRSTYPIVDHTDDIITNILRWSNEWLIKRNAAAEAASEVIYPMPTHFNSFDHYKNIIFPLMKLEIVSTLERDYHMTQKLKIFKVSLEYASLNKDRIMLVTRLNIKNKAEADSIQFDLVILEIDKKGPPIFAYGAAIRKGAGSYTTIIYEIVAKNFTVEYFKSIKELFVRPVMDKVRIHFGAFNAVYQLKNTPLFQKILSPFELLKCKSPPKKKVNYKGFDNLNDKQKHILLNTYTKIIDENTPNISLIQGPPGTGKSCVITNLILQTLYGDEVRYLDKKILFCAQSNAAVDVITAKLYHISMRMRAEKRFRLIRYGLINKIHPSVLPVALQKIVEYDQLKKLQAKNKDIQIENKENLKSQVMQFEAQVAEMSLRNIKGTVEEDLLLEKQRQLQLMRNILNQSMRPEDERSLFAWYLSNANIVCATLSSCVNLMQYINFFDICIIDEATQCTEPWTLLPLKFGINSLVLVGDTQQLPATVLSKKANELGLGKSMFTRIQHCLDDVACSARAKNDSNSVITTPNSVIYSLQTQYRMHPEICRWPNQYFYRNELINAKQTTDLNKSPLFPFNILSLAYTQNNACSNGQITNNLEAEFVAKLLKALDGFIPNQYNSYGVITPYAQQRNTLEASIRSLGLTNIMVNTIDSYQGLEKDVIVISNARTHGIGFLSNPQRLNVALTRAKKCLIVCGSFKNLETVPAWRCLLQNARERKVYHEITVNCITDIQTNVIEKIKLKNNKV